MNNERSDPCLLAASAVPRPAGYLIAALRLAPLLRARERAKAA